MVKPLLKREVSSLEAIISKGGEVAADKPQSDRKYFQMVNLRIRNDLLFQIDEKVEERIGISRTAWILEAIQDKLKKE